MCFRTTLILCDYSLLLHNGEGWGHRVVGFWSETGNLKVCCSEVQLMRMDSVGCIDFILYWSTWPAEIKSINCFQILKVGPPPAWPRFETVTRQEGDSSSNFENHACYGELWHTFHKKQDSCLSRYACMRYAWRGQRSLKFDTFLAVEHISMQPSRVCMY